MVPVQNASMFAQRKPSQNDMWLMAANAFPILPSNLKKTSPQSLKESLKIGCLVAISVKMYARGTAFQTITSLFFNPHPELLSMTKKDWHEITEDVFKKDV